MELFIPSLALILLAVAITFYVLPGFAPTVLVTGSALVLAAALYLHVSQFGVMEYERATWKHQLRNYGSYIMVVLVLLGAYGFYAMNNSQAGGIFSSSSMPALQMPGMSGGGLKDVYDTASSRVRDLVRKGRIDL